jgi:hypothetical protein
MNAKHEPSAEKKALVDTLLAIDSRMPTSSAEGREVAKRVLSRDRRRVRILTWMTSGLFLLTVIGICGALYWYHIKVTPAFEKFHRDIVLLDKQFDKREAKLSEQDLLRWTMEMASAGSYTLFLIQYANLWGILTLLGGTLAVVFCTVMLIIASRRATLGQIQASLLALSEQFDVLQQSLQDDQRPARGGP